MAASVLARPAYFGRRDYRADTHVWKETARGRRYSALTTAERRDQWVVAEYERVTGRKAVSGPVPSLKDPCGWLLPGETTMEEAA